MRATARWAESVGFDSLWLYDHVLFRSPGWSDGAWECWTVLSALAERSFAWHSRNRRLAKDDERMVQTSETLIELACSRLLLRRLALGA
jgi:hypothetical protein